MTNEFVTYEQALVLKELGFEERCFGWYLLDDTKQFVEEKSFKQHFGLCLAPTYSQAFRWFREKYKLQHHIWSGKLNHIFYGYDVLNIEEQDLVVNNSDIGGGDCDYDTYEEAEQACLDKLIEIVKKK